MLEYLRRHHVGLIALFIALGGTAYAASALPVNSVGTSQIRNGAVTRQKLSRGLLEHHNGAARPQPAWRDPRLLRQIGAAGQKVIGQKTVVVNAKSPWVNTSLTLTPGSKLWADTRSDGRWSGNPRLFPYSDANGLGVYPGRYRVDAGAPVLSLIGFVGDAPPTPAEVSVPIGAPAGGPGGISNPGFMAIGDTLRDYKPATSGKVWLRNNDNTNYYSDAGQQVVRVILTSPS